MRLDRPIATALPALLAPLLLPTCTPLVPIPPATPLAEGDLGEMGTGGAFALGDNYPLLGVYGWARLRLSRWFEAGLVGQGTVQVWSVRDFMPQAITGGAFLRCTAPNLVFISPSLQIEAGPVYAGVGLPLSVGTERVSVYTQPTLTTSLVEIDIWMDYDGAVWEQRLLLPAGLSVRVARQVGLNLFANWSYGLDGSEDVFALGGSVVLGQARRQPREGTDRQTPKLVDSMH